MVVNLDIHRGYCSLFFNWPRTGRNFGFIVKKLLPSGQPFFSPFSNSKAHTRRRGSLTSSLYLQKSQMLDQSSFTKKAYMIVDNT